MGREELLHTLPDGYAAATMARSTLLCASMASIRSRGLFDAYMSALPAPRRSEMFAMVAGVWVPMQVAVTHYGACDTLPLDDQQRWEIGLEVGKRVKASVLHVMVRLTREAGATPWTVLANLNRMTAHSWRGSGFKVFKLGPKDARIEWLGQPCAVSKHFTIGFNGFLSGLLGLFAAKAYMKIVPRLSTGDRLVHMVQWV